MLDATSKALFHGLAQIPTLQRLASKYGMAPSSGFARRFIAGETIDEAVACVRDLPGKGLHLTLDYLGESVSSRRRRRPRRPTSTCQIIGAIVASGIERNISLKLTQLGLDVDRATAVDNMRRILEPADADGFFVRIDMENSPYTDATLDILDTLWQQGHQQLGTVIQSCLSRSAADIRRLNAMATRVRLVKGAYKEPKNVAYPEEERSRWRVRRVDAAAARRGHLSGDRHARPADDRCDEGVRGEQGLCEAIASSSRCCTASAAICKRRSSRKATACASTCRSASSGIRTSCAGSASGRRNVAFVLKGIFSDRG